MFKLLCGSSVSLCPLQLAVFIDLGHVLRNERTGIPRSCVSDNGLFLRSCSMQCLNVLIF